MFPRGYATGEDDEDLDCGMPCVPHRPPALPSQNRVLRRLEIDFLSVRLGRAC